jgi:hypothetical protein
VQRIRYGGQKQAQTFVSWLVFPRRSLFTYQCTYGRRSRLEKQPTDPATAGRNITYFREQDTSPQKSPAGTNDELPAAAGRALQELVVEVLNVKEVRT